MVNITDEKIDFKSIFKNCITEIERKESEDYEDYMKEYYQMMFGDGDEYYDWYDDYQSLKDKKNKKNKEDELVWDKDLGQFIKKSAYKKKKKSRVTDDLNDEPKPKKNKKKKKNEDTVVDLLYKGEEKKFIYFYPDVNKRDSRNEYNSLFELDAFLDSENIDIDEETIQFLLHHPVIHCAVKETEHGLKLLVCENSWGNLVFTCCQNMEDLENYD